MVPTLLSITFSSCDTTKEATRPSRMTVSKQSFRSRRRTSAIYSRICKRTSNSRQPTVIDGRVVFKSDLAVCLMLIKDDTQGIHHRGVFGMARLRRVGGRLQPSFQTFKIENLFVWKTGSLESASAKEGTDHSRINLLVIHCGVIGGIGHEQLLVGFEKWGGRSLPVVPDQHDPAAGLENAHKFLMPYRTRSE